MSSPKEQTKKLMKDLREQASMYGYRKLTAKKHIEIKDYMEERLAMWEPDVS